MKYLIALILLSLMSETLFADDREFLAAIETGDLQQIEWLIVDDNYDHNKVATYLITALGLATTESLSLLLKSGFAVDARTNDSMEATALMYAAYYDRVDMMLVLSNSGADINAPDAIGDPAINWAVYGGKRKAVGWLLAKDVRLDQIGHGNAVQIAKRRGYTDIVLMIAATQPSRSVNKGIKALATAIDKNAVDEAVMLVDQGLSLSALDETGRPIFHRAARLNRVEIIDAMLATGIDVNIRDDIGFSALMEASRESHLEMVKLLLHYEADPNLVSYKSSIGLSAIHLAGIGGDLEIIEALDDNNANLNAQDTDGTSAMIWALYEGNKSAAELMLALGADGDLKNKSGISANAILAQYTAGQ